MKKLPRRGDGVCRVCGIKKPVEDFPPGRRQCRECFLKKKKEWRKKNPEKTKKYVQDIYSKRAANPDAYREYTREYEKKNREHRSRRRRLYRLKSVFGLSHSDYVDMLNSQGGVCAICGMPERTGKALSVDHDHATDEIRGLLCSACNTGLGLFGDDPDRLGRAILYVCNNGVCSL